MAETKVVAEGCRVSLHFILTLEDGTVVDSSEGEAPLEFLLGDGTLHPGLEQTLLGLRSGAQEIVELEPEQAFGLPDPQNLHELPRDRFPPEMALEAGTVVEFLTGEGVAVAGTVVAAEAGRVQVDFNHPLAGRRLRFAVEIVAVE